MNMLKQLQNYKLKFSGIPENNLLLLKNLLTDTLMQFFKLFCQMRYSVPQSVQIKHDLLVKLVLFVKSPLFLFHHNEES
jgi:hypothetical protein